MKYLIQEHRYLLNFFAAKNPWTVLYFVLPLLAGLMYLMDEIRVINLFIALPLSFLYWSFVEYLIHRYFFHWVPKNRLLRYLTSSFHLYHHENPTDTGVINSGWVTGTLGVFFHFGIFYFVFQASLQTALELTFTLVVVYYYYEWVHFKVHEKIYEKGLMRFLQNFHLTHHVSPRCNFGQISPIWDFVLGTMKENKETKDTPRMRAFVKGAR